jgi:hypothetical protein
MGCTLVAPSQAVARPDSTHSSSTALWMSLALPGLGQWYNEQYWKVPIMTGTCAVSAWFVVSNHGSFRTASDAYDAAVLRGATSIELSQLRAQRETYRNNRDVAGLVFVAAYAIAALDAYVGAELYDFDVSPDLSIGIGPSSTHMMAVNVRLHW